MDFYLRGYHEAIIDAPNIPPPGCTIDQINDFRMGWTDARGDLVANQGIPHDHQWTTIQFAGSKYCRCSFCGRAKR